MFLVKGIPNCFLGCVPEASTLKRNPHSSKPFQRCTDHPWRGRKRKRQQLMPGRWNFGVCHESQRFHPKETRRPEPSGSVRWARWFLLSWRSRQAALRCALHPPELAVELVGDRFRVRH